MNPTMNMGGSMNGMLHITAMDVIVGLALLFAVLFVIAWIASPRLRQWIERPKFGFQAAVASYDHAQRWSSTLKERKAPR